MKETVSGGNFSGWKGILFILWLFLGIMAAVLLTNLASNYIGPLANYVLVACLVLLGWLLIKFRVSQFHYVIDDDGLHILRLIGGRDKLLLSLAFADIKGFSTNDGNGIKPKEKFAFLPYGECVCVTYSASGRVNNFYFSPSDDFYAELVRRVDGDTDSGVGDDA